MKASTLIMSSLLSSSSILATDFFGTELTDKCIDYIHKADPIVNKVGPQFQQLEDNARGSSVEQPAIDANAAVQSALKLYESQKNGVLDASTVAQDKLEVQRDLKKVKPAISVISRTSDAPVAVLDSVRALNTTRAEAIAYGKAGVGTCSFRDLRELKKASTDAQNAAQARFATKMAGYLGRQNLVLEMFHEDGDWDV